MTLGRLIELYQAEQQGKQIMMRVVHHGNYVSYDRTGKVKIAECELQDLVLEEDDVARIFFIKDEEDKHGCKLELL